MGFEIVAPRMRIDGLTKGQCSIAQPGRVGITFADLSGVKVSATDTVTILADKMTGRIAIRKSKDGEPSMKVMYNKARSVGQITITAAIDTCGKKIDQVKGRYAIMQKDDLLIVQLK